ncbi:MAG: TetR/AcrR family transcriptional regulator, partial [Terracoccus sp.]
AFGASRLERNLASADLLLAAASDHGRPLGALRFVAAHVRQLLLALEIGGDPNLLTSALLAPLEASVVSVQVTEQGIDPTQILAGWTDLVRRVVRTD